MKTGGHSNKYTPNYRMSAVQGCQVLKNLKGLIWPKVVYKGQNLKKEQSIFFKLFTIKIQRSFFNHKFGYLHEFS